MTFHRFILRSLTLVFLVAPLLATTFVHGRVVRNAATRTKPLSWYEEGDTNGKRLARGLTPLPPHLRRTPTGTG